MSVGESVGDCDGAVQEKLSGDERVGTVSGFDQRCMNLLEGSEGFRAGQQRQASQRDSAHSCLLL